MGITRRRYDYESGRKWRSTLLLSTVIRVICSILSMFFATRAIPVRSFPVPMNSGQWRRRMAIALLSSAVQNVSHTKKGAYCSVGARLFKTLAQMNTKRLRQGTSKSKHSCCDSGEDGGFVEILLTSECNHHL